ncbi:MAG: glycoside hydrolase family 38 C-terminal domain-containing protein [Prolixibacteraceae bacterium]
MQNHKTKTQLSRRNFLRGAASGTALLALAPATNLFSNTLRSGTAWTEDATKFKIHMIGQAHIDPVWLWSWSEGISVVHSTFQSALDRMKETPDFKFTASSAQFYQWVAENDPNMLKEIRKRVEEGRWSAVGGWWVEPDMNIPSGEAMVRQGLYGQLTLQKLLGHRSTVAYNPDSFGHTGNLPQIIKLQGMENYIFMRPGIREKTIPSDLFWWEGTDGTKVLTYRIQFGYNDSGSVRTRVENLVAQYGNQPMKSFMAYYGAGDHGGGATKINISSINELKVEKGAPTVVYSTPETYFKEAHADKSLNLPTIKDDLQHHAVGCYTAESEIKKGNRQSESALVTAEKVAAIGSVAWGAHYPKQELTAAWHKVLFLQFHDSLAGSSLFDHSQSAREGFGYAQDVAHQATFMGVQKLEWQVATEDPDSQYLLVFNPHAWEVNGKVEYDFNWNSSHKSSRVDDETGNALPHQWTAGSSEAGSRKKLVVGMNVPPMGYRQIRLWDAENPAPKSVVKVTESTLENDLIKVRISYNGTIGIFDKVTGKELFSGGDTGCKAIIIDDPSDTWSHDIKTFNKEIGAFGNATIKVLEEGPLRGKIRSVATYGSSTLTIDWILYADSKNPEAAVTLDWHEHLKMVKFSFPVEVESPAATYETSYGTIVRATNGDEDPGQRWIDVTGKRGSVNYGLSVFNDAKYGYSIAGSDLRISVARSAVYAHHNPKVLDMKAEHLWQDQGIQTFRLLLVPHVGNWQHSNMVRIAEEFMAPSIPIYQGIHRGSMPKSGSFLAVDAQNIIVSAVKQSEVGEDLILRCVETNGKAVTANLDLGFAKKKWSGNFRPYEIKTLRFNAKSGGIKEVNLLEE